MIPHIVLAMKDAEGSLEWVEFEKVFHSHLVQRAKSVLASSDCSLTTVKKSLFVFILETLNGEGPSAFFDLEKGASSQQRLDHEKKRLQRKRSRAAKRERERHAAKVVNQVSRDQPPALVVNHKRNGVLCVPCGKMFASRRKLNKHKCQLAESADRSRSSTPTLSTAAPVNDGSGSIPASSASSSIPDRSAVGVLLNLPPGPRYIGRGISVSPTSVLGRSLVSFCENCPDNYALCRKHGLYPKCLDCALTTHGFKLRINMEYMDDAAEEVERLILG